MKTNKDTVDQKIDHKLGMLIEHIDERFQRILEAGQNQSESLQQKLQSISDRVERIEFDTARTKLSIITINHDVRMLKLRSDKKQNGDKVSKSLKDIEQRITKLEATS